MWRGPLWPSATDNVDALHSTYVLPIDLGNDYFHSWLPDWCSMTAREIGLEYLDALADAQEAQKIYETNDEDDYDPCGDTQKRVTAELEAALARLALATKALIESV